MRSHDTVRVSLLSKVCASLGEKVVSSRPPLSPNEISDQLITVEEGSSSGKVLCTAEAYPEANYQWQFGSDIVATDNVLFFDYGISRHQSGDYNCIAQNRHGSTKISTKIDVLCKLNPMSSCSG